MRRQAAAVPASKAKIGKIYAVKRDDELTRFRVTKVTISRIADDGSPHDYESVIEGEYLLAYDDPAKGWKTEKATIEPRHLLGQFEDYQELVAKKEAEDKARRELNKAIEKDARDLWVMLYKVAGLPVPKDSSGYHLPFRLTGYALTAPDIGKDGVKPLLEGLRKLWDEAGLAHSANLIEREKVDG